MTVINEIRDEINRRRIVELRDTVRKANRPFRREKSKDLYKELLNLEIEYPEMQNTESPTHTVKPKVKSIINKVNHRKPILSLREVEEKRDLKDFIGGEYSVLIQDNLEGLTIVLSYSEGELVKTVTKGNGVVGEDLTHNIEQITNVPKNVKCKSDFEVVGKVTLSHRNFERINYKNEYKDTCDTIDKIVRSKDSKKMIGKGFRVITFDLEFSNGLIHHNDEEQLSFLRDQGFEIVRSQLIEIPTDKNKNQLLEIIRINEENISKTLPYNTKGLVFKVNQLTRRKIQGSDDDSPRWAIAYKYKKSEMLPSISTGYLAG